MEKQKNFLGFSRKLKNKDFQRRLKPFRGINRREELRVGVDSFGSELVGTNQAHYGSANPAEREQIMTEMSREGSKKVPSVSHSRPQTGRGVNALNTGSTNRNQFDFRYRGAEPLEQEEHLFLEKGSPQDFRFSGGGSSLNGGLFKSITNEPFNLSLGLCTPRDNLIEDARDEGEKGVLTVEAPEKKGFLFSKGVKSERRKEEKKQFFRDIEPIIEHSESKISRTIKAENSEAIVRELSEKLSKGSTSQKLGSSGSKKRGGKKKHLKLRLRVEEKALAKAAPAEGVQSLNPVFNVPSILKTNRSHKKRKSVSFRKDNFFKFKVKEEIPEKSFGHSANTSNLVPSIHRNKLKPQGAPGNLINRLAVGQDPAGPKSLQPQNQPCFAFNIGSRLNRRGAQLKKAGTQLDFIGKKSRPGGSPRLSERKSHATEKTRRKGARDEDKNILKVVGKRVLKRVKECIKGIENLNVKISTDKKSKKITFSINDLNDQDYGLQFDFVMGNESQEVNLNEYMVSSYEATPKTPGTDRIAFETPKPRPLPRFSRKKHLKLEKEGAKPLRIEVEASGKNSGENRILGKIGEYPNVQLQEAKREVQQFGEYMSEKLGSRDWGCFSKFVLQLLYGVGITSEDFAQMGLAGQKMFKKLLVDRYFKDVKKNIYERLQKNPHVRDLLLPPGKHDNLDIWGVSVEDFRVFFGEFAVNFGGGPQKNFPELGAVFQVLKESVAKHLDSSSRIASLVGLVGQQEGPLPSVDSERRQSWKDLDAAFPGQRKKPLFQCHDFSVVQGSGGSRKSRPLKTLQENGVFVEGDDEESEFTSFKMTPSCGGNTSANFKKPSKFSFTNTQMMMSSPGGNPGKPDTPAKTKPSLAELRTQLTQKVDGCLASLVEAVMPDLILKEKLLRNLRIFLGNLTNDLILHMVKINYLKKGKKIDEEGDGMVDLEVSEMLGQILVSIARDMTQGVSRRDFLSTEFLQKFDFEIDLQIVQDFLEKREALNCLQRKKNNKYQRPKRNDEKVKKVYKKIMNQFLDEFKRRHFGVKDREDQNTYFISISDPVAKPQMDYSYAFKPKEMELCFYVHYFGHLCSPPLRFCSERVPVEVWGGDSERHLARWHLTGLSDKEISTRAKMLISIGEEKGSARRCERQMNQSIAKSFKDYKERSSYKARSTKSRRRSTRGARSADMNKINSFFDPTKKNFESRVFLSFTQEYFNHLLQAERFQARVIHYLKERFVPDFMKDYPAEIAKKLERNRFHMLDLQKKKSKFLWNRCELMVALEYFKEKYCKGILSKKFPCAPKKDPLSLDVESFEGDCGSAHLQSGLLKYFTGPGNPDSGRLGSGAHFAFPAKR